MGFDLFALLSAYKYLILAPAALVLGPAVSLVAGVLLRVGELQLLPTCLALAAGELGGDLLWYWLGRRYGHTFAARYGRYIGVSEASVESVKGMYARYHDIIIFTSKLTGGLGFGIPIMFTAGLSHVPFRRYMMLSIAGQFLWTAGLLSIGYFLGHVYLYVGNVFEKVALLALSIIILVSIIGFGKYVRESFQQS